MSASGRKTGASAPGPQPNIESTALSPSGTNWVAFSGGPDSVCLLHLLTSVVSGTPIRVVHVDHRLDEHSAARADRAVEIAADLGVHCNLERLDPIQSRGEGGPEAAARRARYARLQALMAPGDHVLTGHHADDQIETLMLRLLRGSGPEGLRGMQPLRRLAPGWLGRPLLAWSRAEILAYLQRHDIDYLHDPTNRDLSLDRNYIRHRVLPAIEQRWPGYRSSLLQASRWQDAAARCLTDEAGQNLDRLSRQRDGAGETTLDIAGWLALDAERSFAAVRAWCIQQGIASPATRPLTEFREQCGKAGPDRQPALDWPDARLHAWRGRLWMDIKPAVQDRWRHDWPTGDSCPIPAGGQLVWTGVVRSEFGKHWQVSALPTGAGLRLQADGPEKNVTELMRQAGIPPWRRHAYPALVIDGRLRAVGIEWMDWAFAAWLDQSGSRLEWQKRPSALLP